MRPLNLRMDISLSKFVDFRKPNAGQTTKGGRNLNGLNSSDKALIEKIRAAVTNINGAVNNLKTLNKNSENVSTIKKMSENIELLNQVLSSNSGALTSSDLSSQMHGIRTRLTLIQGFSFKLKGFQLNLAPYQDIIVRNCQELLQNIDELIEQPLAKNNKVIDFLALNQTNLGITSVSGDSREVVYKSSISVKSSESENTDNFSPRSISELSDACVSVSSVQLGQVKTSHRMSLVSSKNGTDFTDGESDLVSISLAINDELEEKKKSIKELKVLIVDDTAVQQKMLKKTLSNHFGISTIDIACNGQEGVEASKFVNLDGTPGYDVIFMDMEMPVLDGLDATKAIKRLSSEIKIIGYSSNNSSLSKFMEAGADHAILKAPNNQHNIRLTLEELFPSLDETEVNT